MKHTKHALALAGITFAAALTGGSAFAHGEKAHATAAAPVPKEQKPWGIAGEASDAKRTMEVTMTDDMRFTPSNIEVKQGETVKFVVRNKGKVLHEMVLGDRKSLDEHAALMQKFPGMEHDEPHMSHVAAGKAGTLVWNFNRAGDFDFACLIPGHYQAGMVGKIKVLPRQ
ncbi:cupredoxin domain-containing protein [Ramlibacter pallidus]|uniref:Cupredoxin domain-containing protein n=1 Tax=Ramlibacter pallidus TaxID=2780087 RepID=A0ABR9RYT5_9BURK|nr:cupredoxin family protein [Ramlibacter pallidus]MBE7366049.1 cupredoxin domain-containing protein [Ramlibacter pallidus]